ncbi:MAG TPA: chorismate mutase [Nocardioides sp.]|nr:chorismate mutase [Nocardioides sp.]
MAVRAVRGATQLDVDEREHMLARVTEMVTEVMDANGWDVDDFISIIFTATTDLVSEFPAYAARMLGFTDVPLICTRELEVEGSMPRVVRMMAHVESDLPRADITHVYLHGAAALRRDLARVRTVPDTPFTAEPDE